MLFSIERSVKRSLMFLSIFLVACVQLLRWVPSYPDVFHHPLRERCNWGPCPSRPTSTAVIVVYHKSIPYKPVTESEISVSFSAYSVLISGRTPRSREKPKSFPTFFVREILNARLPAPQVQKLKSLRVNVIDSDTYRRKIDMFEIRQNKIEKCNQLNISKVITRFDINS